MHITIYYNSMFYNMSAVHTDKVLSYVRVHYNIFECGASHATVYKMYQMQLI